VNRPPPTPAPEAFANPLKQPASPVFISARDNPLLVRLRRLAQDGAAYRRLGQVWLEGEHLCAALRTRGRPALQAVLTEAAWDEPAVRELACWAPRLAVVPAALFKGLSGLGSPARIGFVIDTPPPAEIDAHAPSVVLDRVQDAGNVGSILRSAAAFGVSQVLALKGSAALWSPKVLRAAMGAHFGLRLIEGLEETSLDALAMPMVATTSHGGAALPDATLPTPCAWVLGHEGQGVSAGLQARCALSVCIPQPGGEESLNVAAAAAVCLYAWASASRGTAGRSRPWGVQ
jgi:TrmH family RNA methyltransferase